MLKEMKLIPVTETSRPFTAAKDLLDLDACGYTEDEYFMYGTADIYDEDQNNQPVVAFKAAPYCTRVMIRRPSDPAVFSGNVVIEIVNSTANFDIDRQWINSWPFFTRNGDIYVGISSKGQIVDALKNFDGERYADINWKNPRPFVPLTGPVTGFRTLPQFEMGLFWDMLIDLAKVLREDSDANPLRAYGKNWLYLTGWSQSSVYVNRMVRSFIDHPELVGEGKLFDGYLNGGGMASLAPMNNDTPMNFGRNTNPVSAVFGCRDPFIAVNTESENRINFWYGDFDEPAYKFRTWQIAGSSHDSKYNLLDYYGEEGRAVLEKLDRKVSFDGVDGEPLDTPYGAVFNAAYMALYRWVREGIPAPHAPKIETNVTEGLNPTIGGYTHLLNLTDAFGNCRGGIRTPWISYPTAKYESWSTLPDGSLNGAFGKEVPFSAAMLKELYGSLEHYKELLAGDIDRLVAEGFMLEGDKEAVITHLAEKAAQRGLA